jgi:hypothetical protein
MIREEEPSVADAEHPNILVIWGDDNGIPIRQGAITIDQVVAKLESALTAGH